MDMPQAARGAFARVADFDLGSEETPAQSGPTVAKYLRIGWRWKKVILACVVGCFILGLIVTLLLTPQYTAKTMIEIARESNKIVDIQGVQQDASVGDLEFYQTQYGLLRSRSLAERVATKLKLVDNPAFFKMFGASLRDNGGSDAPFSTARRPERLRLAGETLLKHIEIAPTRLSRLVEVRFTGPDATLATQITNSWSANFIEETLERRFQATAYARTFLEGRLEQLRGKLEDSERQLVAYATAEGIINLPSTGPSDSKSVERSIITDNISAFNDSLSKATAERVQAQARFEQSRGRGGDVSEALSNDAISVMRQRRAELAAQYEKLMVQFEPGYPAARALASQIGQLDRSLNREERRVSNSLATTYRESQQRERMLAGKVEGLKSTLLDLRRRSIQYNIYQRDADTNRQLYDGLLQRYKEIGVAGGVGVNNVSIVDSAIIPDRASSPRFIVNLLASLLAGLAMGVGLALILEQNDELISDPDELRGLLSIASLGSIPKVVASSPAEALLDRKSELVDAYLAVQTNLCFATDHGIPKTLAVTSTRPAEGKSTTAFAVSTMLARSGKRVVLIDGDMRSPSVRALAGITQDAGLSNFLAGADAIDPLLVPVEAFGFTVMTAGPIPPNAAELLLGSRLNTLLDSLLARFDHVIIDSPPVMGLADAPLICGAVEGAIFVVEANGIRATLVRTALTRLKNANVRVFGGVLTKFDSVRSQLGYGYDYGYGYGRDDRVKEAS
jgi:polysaccharide biosynthesis transport protein